MRISIITMLCVLIFTQVMHSQIKAVTDKGDEVLLHNDGTWEYLDVAIEESEEELVLNPKEYKTGENSTFLVKSQKSDVGIYLDSKKWKFNKAVHNPHAEYEFHFKKGDLYAMLISEAIEIPVTKLKDLAFTMAQSVSPNMARIKQEYRMINGLEVVYMEMRGEVQGIDLTYAGYYYSNNNGSNQVLTYTSSKLFEESKNEIEEFLNGLVVLKED